jgi:site-specific recombinase XerD
VRDAKLEDFALHSCRHHFASWFIMRGGNIVALQEVLGHASRAMTRRYAHLSPDQLRAEVGKTERPAAEAQGERTVVDSTADHAVTPRNAGVDS